MSIGLHNSIISKITSVLASFPEVEEAILYGSRAKGNFKKGSDIDLALRGKKVSMEKILKISHQFDELEIPYTLDVRAIHFIENKNLLDHIARVGKVFYQANSISA